MNVIGIDIGTTTLSALVLEAETGAVLETVTVPNGCEINAGRQDVNSIVKKAFVVVRKLKSKYSPVGVVGLDGQMHGMLYIDSEGNSVSPLYTWQNDLGDRPLEQETYAARLSRLTGYHMATGFGGTTHYWHHVNNRIPKAAVAFCTIQDYIGMKMTGRRKPVLHISDAASYGLFDITSRDFDRSAIEKAGMDSSFFPPVCSGPMLLGYDADGVAVSVAIGDNQASFFGSVREPRCSVMVNMGTGGQISMMTDRTDIKFEKRPLNDGDSLLVVSSLCGGRAFALLEGFIRSCISLAGLPCESAYQAMGMIGEEALGYSDKLTIRPFFCGTREDPFLRASIENIDAQNFTAGHLVGGMLEGMVKELYEPYCQMLAAGAKKPTVLVGAGNAIRKNSALQKAFERCFNMKMNIPGHYEEAAYGAALFAIVSAGFVESLPDAQKKIRYQEEWRLV